jgi:hypothetical protein
MTEAEHDIANQSTIPSGKKNPRSHRYDPFCPNNHLAKSRSYERPSLVPLLTTSAALLSHPFPLPPPPRWPPPRPDRGCVVAQDCRTQPNRARHYRCLLDLHRCPPLPAASVTYAPATAGRPILDHRFPPATRPQLDAFAPQAAHERCIPDRCAES